MKLYIYSVVLYTGLLFGAQNNIVEKKAIVNEADNIDGERSFRTGDFALVCQNESGSYNMNMLNYVTSPTINIPAGDEVSVDFLLRGSFLDPDAFEDGADFWGMQISNNGGQTWYYVSNPYGDTTGTFPNYVYSDAPEFWSLFSQTYSTPIDIDDYAGSSIKIRYWFDSDGDAPQGEGLFFDDIAVNVDGQDIYFESFEDSTMAGWVTDDRTAPGPAWHPDTYGAHGGAGSSWWMADANIGSNGGYYNHWYQVLDTPPIDIPAGTSTYSVAFDQKRAIENLCTVSCPDCDPGVVYDGWDAFNVRISADGGVSWEVLEDAFPIYNTRDTYSFGYEFGEGCGIPGWGGPETANPTWEYTEVDIPQSYNGQEVIVRFAFSADPGYDTESNSDLQGIWIDNIDVAGVFTNDGEDEFVNQYPDSTQFEYTSADGFLSQSFVTEGNGDLWHVDFIGVPPVIPMPENVVVSATDGSVEVAWDSPPGGVEYSDQWVSYDDGTFENAIVLQSGQGYLGNNFGMPYGVETVTVHAARVWASNAGTTTLAGFAVVGGFPSPTPLYEVTISTDAESFTSEIPLDWEFQSSFVIALLVTDVIGLGIDESSAPSSSSWSNLGGWSSWSEVAANTDGISDGEFGIQARITSIGGSSPTFNVYRDPGLDGGSYQLMFNGAGISQTSYSDNIVDNGVEYCYRIASVYDEAVSEQTAPQCGLPISNTVYDIIYDDGTSEDVMPVGNGNYVASKFTPEGYPSDLYAASFYLPNSQSGTVLVYVWDDDGDNGTPGTPLVQGFPLNMIQGWNDINFANEGFTIPIADGVVFVGYKQLAVNFTLGVDWNNSSHAQNSILDLGFGLGWESLSNYSPNGVWMIRAQMDGANAVMGSDDDFNNQIPDQFTLSQNYPNPFNPMTRIQFGLSKKAKTRLEIFNILGESVQVVVNEHMDAGFYNYNISMNGLSSGMYFYRLVVVGENGQQLYNEMKKMILVR